MEITLALSIYTVVVVAIVFFAWRHGLRLVSAVIVALIIGQILLNVLTPVYSVHSISMSSPLAIYYAIQFLTPLAVYIYALVRGWQSRRK